MRKLILILSLMTLPIISFGQISEKKFKKTIESINQNPTDPNNKLFVSKSSDLIMFQLYNYPNFPINVSGTKELDKEWKGHKYEKYFIIVYSFNQLYYKLENKKFDNLNACVFSINKLIESYSKIIKENPDVKIKIFDEYKELDEKELVKRIKRLV
ncbi:hypothetical protein [Algibacter sp. R77976]|uniref:hypothetical protein n=1 Tax=Algibacter sp. R77976 TaxID=3093873 RepID=UPI0037C5ACC6